MQFVRDTDEEKIESKFHDMQFLKDFQSSQPISRRTIETQTSETQVNQDSDERFLWEKYSTGVVSEIMEKMGFKEKGLGKAENGDPITVEKKDRFKSTSEKKRKVRGNHEVVYVLTDSMLNQLNQEKLSRKYKVIVQCHGRYTIRCVYAHLPHDRTKTRICAYTHRNERLHHEDIMRSEEGIRKPFKVYSKQTTNHQIDFQDFSTNPQITENYVKPVEFLPGLPLLVQNLPRLSICDCSIDVM